MNCQQVLYEQAFVRIKKLAVSEGLPAHCVVHFTVLLNLAIALTRFAR